MASVWNKEFGKASLITRNCNFGVKVVDIVLLLMNSFSLLYRVNVSGLGRNTHAFEAGINFPKKINF